MYIGTLFPASAAGSAQAEVIGNGHVVHNEGQLVGRSILAVSPLGIENADGIGGATLIKLQPQSMLLGKLIGANGQLTSDQPFEMEGADTYIIRRVVFANPSAQPTTTIKGGIYTRAGKSGRTVIPATQGYDGLDPLDEHKIVEVSVALGYSHRAPQLFLSLTTAEATPLTFDVYVFGDAMKSIPA